MGVYNPIMRKAAHGVLDSSQWAVRASSWDFRVSQTHPYEASVARFARPTSLRVSVHDGLELCVLVEGAQDLYLHRCTFHGQPGDVWLVGMWEPHRWRVTEPHTKQLSIIFLPEFLGDHMLGDSSWLELFTCDPADRPVVSSDGMRERIVAIARQLEGEIEDKSPGWHIALRLGLGSIILALSRGLTRSSAAAGRRRAQVPGLDRITPALAAVHARPAERITVNDAAAACGLSAAQFSRVFREITGLSFGRFRLRAHLAYAAHLLLTTDLAIDTIAAKAGFVDGSHLHRNFLRYYGETPGRYRMLGR